jgi:hypothetical protein
VIVVVGSHHDPIARELIAGWPGAALCSASDVVTSGWCWSPTGAVDARWVIDGKVVADTTITGAFVRRAAFYPEEFTDTHPDDRAYLAAEAHAFLADVLASTSALVSIPAGDGTFGDELLPPGRWMRAAIDCGLTTAPVRARSNARAGVLRRTLRRVEVVGGVPIGTGSTRTLRGLGALANALGVRWATAILDGRNRVVALTSAAVPSTAARAALGRLLAQQG